MVWCVLATLHNILDIPPEYTRCSEKIQYRIDFVVRDCNADVVSAPAISALCCPHEVTESPMGNELSLGGTPSSVDSHFNSCVWEFRGSLVSAVVVVNRVIANGATSVVCTSAPVLLSVDDIVENRKMSVFFSSTSFGLVGCSVSVSPLDRSGYIHRLESFLAQHNPRGLALVADVVELVPEVDTFSKLRRKYGLCDYPKRLNDLFAVYDPSSVKTIPDLLQKWENREEELMRSVILSHGPEPCDIPMELRFAAFLDAHQLVHTDSGVVEALKVYQQSKDSSGLFRQLTSCFGCEPNPRSYLGKRHETESSGERPKKETNDVRVSPDAVDTVAPCAEDGVYTQPTNAPVIASHGIKLSNAASSQAPSGSDALWKKFCRAMNETVSGSLWDDAECFYCSEDDFERKLSDLDIFNREERQILSLQWRRRVQAAVKHERLQPSDSQYAAVVQEVVALCRLQPVHFTIHSIASVFNEAHHGFFSSKLESAGHRQIERYVLLGEYEELMDVVKFGVRRLTTSNIGQPCTIFHQEPFKHWTRGCGTSLLLCDVVVGHKYTCSESENPPLDSQLASHKFLRDYDSCEFVSKLSGQGTAVFSPQQVLPRFMIQCSVDPTLLPCPSHRDRAVEYYVEDAEAFACSRCAVSGQFSGQVAMPIEDAAVQARSKLAELQRTTESIRGNLTSIERQLDADVAALPTAPRRVEARKQVDRIRREMEEQIASIMRSVEAEEKEELARITSNRGQVEATREEAIRITTEIGRAIAGSRAVEVIQALQRLQEEKGIERLVDHVQQLPQLAAAAVVGLNTSVEETDHHRETRHSNSTRPNKRTVGLNESRLTVGRNNSTNDVMMSTHMAIENTGDRGEVFTRKAKIHPSRPKPSALYAEYAALMENKTALEQDSFATPNVRSGHRQGLVRPRASGALEPTGTSQGQRVPGERGRTSNNSVLLGSEAESLLTRGWSLLRQGNMEGARQLWTHVADSCMNGANEVLGKKAHAYMAEAIEKDYNRAAHFYAQCLQLDPSDRMTAYNYGVLLEAVLGNHSEALRMYDMAAVLGDEVAAARAHQIRASQQGWQ